MQEIKAVLRKYDAAGFVILSSPTHMEFLHHFDPDWLPMFWEKPPGEVPGIRFRCRRADYPSVEAWKESMKSGAGFILGTVDVLRKHLECYESLAVQMGKSMVVSHTTIDEGPHDNP